LLDPHIIHFNATLDFHRHMRRFFQSLQSKLILLIVLVAIPGLVGLIYELLLERENAINEAVVQAVNTAEITTADQSTLIERTHKFLARLSTFESVLDPSSPNCSLFLADVLKINDSYINIGVPRVDGDLLCNAKALKEPINVSDRPYIQKSIATRAFSIGEFQVDRATGMTSINFAYPVIHPESDNVVGLAVAVISLDWWSKHLSQSHLPEKTVAYITDHEQIIIAVYPSNTELLGSHIKSVLGENLDYHTTLDHSTKIMRSPENYLRAFVNRPLFNNSELIRIRVGIPIGAKLSAINSRFINTGLFIFLFVFLMFMIAKWGIKRSLLNPLEVLLQSTKNLEAGIDVGNISQHGSFELIELQKRFTLMAKTRLNAEQQLKNSQNSLQESEIRLSSHIENTPLACISWDKNFKCTQWNKSAENIFGYLANEAIGIHAYKLIVAPELQNKIKNIYKLLLEKNGGRIITNENLTKHGNTIVCEWHNTLVRAKDGSVIGVTSLIKDVTQNKQLEEKLKLAASVFSHAREGIIITDAKGIIIDVNDTFVDITGFERKDVLGKTPSMLKSTRQSPEFYSQLRKSLADEGNWYGEIWNKRKNNEIYAQLLTISAVHDDDGKVKNYVAVFTDISEIKEQQLQLEHMAHYDVLTNLPNRSLLAERLNQAMNQSKNNKKPLAVIFLDLDGFKEVNDTHGHSLGDELLVTLSHRLKDALRECDTLSRFGGDEFVAVLANLEQIQDFEPIVDRMLIAASKPIIINGKRLKVSASIGVTLYPLDNTDADQLIRHADQAMYIAKQEGKNCYNLFDIESEDAIRNRHEKIQNIALALKNQEFALYYQPKVNMCTGEVIGAEALIRWLHPIRGLLSPMEFLPLIENHHLSVDIGEWVIDEALKQLEKWQKCGLKIPVSVNIGALQIQQKNFANRLESLLSDHPSIEPYYLELEVLETSALGDVMDASKIMSSCLKLGVTFAIDDFGTGYSSLTYLRRLPATLIKIDQTFIRDMLLDPEDKAIVIGIVALAASFNRRVLAEGVETIEHGTALIELGCELAQGYGIARPMPADQIPEWANNWKPDTSWQSSTLKMSALNQVNFWKKEFYNDAL
jgi:diguanylate cyclase (GGDEF)-like protein/PAS domain S-box-containing protein